MYEEYEHDIHDITPLMEAKLNISKRAFSLFRKALNGDGTIQYRIQQDPTKIISIPVHTMEKIIAMMRASHADNLERPFFIIFDEENLRAVDIVVGPAGDEESCTHTEALVHCTESKIKECLSSLDIDINLHPPCLRLSPGHTHPVFPRSSHPALATQMGMKVSQEVKFGALPSNIFGQMMEWRERYVAAPTASKRDAIDEILAKKLYKRNCEDYVESYMTSHRAGFLGGDPEAKGSRFHWIITPRLGQIGVFEVPEDEYGAVVYYRWQSECIGAT